MTLITPADVRELLIAVTRGCIGQHIDAYKADRDQALDLDGAKVLVSALAKPGERHRAQRAPCVLIGVTDWGDDPELDDEGDLHVTWEVVVEIYVVGRNRTDVLRRRDVLQMVALECLLSRTPRGREGDLIDGITLGGFVNDDADPENRDTEGTAGFSLFVDVGSVLSTTRFPRYGAAVPAAGEPGGPPTPGGVPVPWPDSHDLTDDIDRQE